MRPSKLGTHIITAFRELLEEDELHILVYTDKDLCFLLNQRLTDEHQVSYRTFQRYKAAVMKGAEKDIKAFDIVYQRFYELMTEALLRMKKRLMQKIIEAEKGWQRFKWMLEMKFKEWNLHWQIRQDKWEEEPEAHTGPAKVVMISSDIADMLDKEILLINPEYEGENSEDRWKAWWRNEYGAEFPNKAAPE